MKDLIRVSCIPHPNTVRQQHYKKFNVSNDNQARILRDFFSLFDRCDFVGHQTHVYVC